MKSGPTRGAGGALRLRDSNELLEDENRDPLHLWYALSWPDWFFWDGEGRIPRHGAQSVAGGWSTQSSPRAQAAPLPSPRSRKRLSEALDAGVDLLSTDDLQRLEQFLDARPLMAPGPP